MLERHFESSLWADMLAIIEVVTGLAVNVVNGPVIAGGVALVGALFARARAMRTTVWNPHPAIDKVNLVMSLFSQYILLHSNFISNCRPKIIEGLIHSRLRNVGDTFDFARLIYLDYFVTFTFRQRF